MIFDTLSEAHRVANVPITVWKHVVMHNGKYYSSTGLNELYEGIHIDNTGFNYHTPRHGQEGHFYINTDILTFNIEFTKLQCAKLGNRNMPNPSGMYVQMTIPVGAQYYEHRACYCSDNLIWEVGAIIDDFGHFEHDEWINSIVNSHFPDGDKDHMKTVIDYNQKLHTYTEELARSEAKGDVRSALYYRGQKQVTENILKRN